MPEDTRDFHEAKIEGLAGKVAVHTDTRARAVKKDKNIGIFQPQEEASEKIYKQEDGITATVSTSQEKVNQRAASKPRTEGIDAKLEGSEDLEDLKVLVTTGNTTVHRDMKERAVKKDKPIGVNVNEEEAIEQYFEGETEAIATVSTSKSKAGQRASSQPQLEGLETKPEGIEELEIFGIEGTTGNLAVHKDTRERAVLKGKPIGVNVTEEETNEQSYPEDREAVAKITTLKTNINQRAASTSRMEGLDDKTEDVDDFNESCVQGLSGTMAVHEDTRGKAVKKVKPIGINITQEEAGEQMYKGKDEAVAKVSTTESKVNQRAAAKPRIEGLDTYLEGTQDIEEFEDGVTSASATVHKDKKGKAVKKVKPVGINVTEEKACVQSYKTDGEALATVSTSRVNVDQRADSKARLEGLGANQEDAVDFEERTPEEITGSVAVHKDNKGRAVKKDMTIGQYVSEEKTSEQSYPKGREALATVKTSKTRLVERATGEPRLEGLDAKPEETEELEEFQTENSA